MYHVNVTAIRYRNIKGLYFGPHLFRLGETGAQQKRTSLYGLASDLHNLEKRKRKS